MNSSKGDPPRLAGIPLGDRVGALVAVLGGLAALLALAALFLPVYEITINGLPCEPAQVELAERCSDNALPALIPLGLLALVLAIGAGPGGSRPAAVALALVGVAILAIVLIFDLPKLGAEGAIGRSFEFARTNLGPGLVLEALAGVLALAAGLLRVLRPWTGDERSRPAS